MSLFFTFYDSKKIKKKTVKSTEKKKVFLFLLHLIECHNYVVSQLNNDCSCIYLFIFFWYLCWCWWSFVCFPLHRSSRVLQYQFENQKAFSWCQKMRRNFLSSKQQQQHWQNRSFLLMTFLLCFALPTFFSCRLQTL